MADEDDGGYDGGGGDDAVDLDGNFIMSWHIDSYSPILCVYAYIFYVFCR